MAAVIERWIPPTPEDWRVLRALSLYRLVLVTVLVAIERSGYGATLFDAGQDVGLHGLLAQYALVALILLMLVRRQTFGLPGQGYLHFACDAGAILLLMSVCGGVGGGFGVLLLTPAIGCSLVLPRRPMVALAAVIAVAIVALEWHRQPTLWTVGRATSGGLLGAILLATTVFGGAVGSRARRMEALALRVGSDLASLSRLNERIIESMEIGVLVVDAQGTIRLANAASRRLFSANGGVPLEQAELRDTSPRLSEEMARWREQPGRDSPPVEALPAGPEVVPRFMPLGYGDKAPMLVMLDPAARLREQAQQIKLAALGRLSAGIAHEIRNPLSAIHHAAQLLSESEQLHADDRRLLEMIERHSARIDKIVRDVLNLSRRDAAAPHAIELRAWLGRTIAAFCEGTGRRAQSIHMEQLPEHLSVRFDSNHLQQVLFNLWENSFEHSVQGREVEIQLRGGALPGGVQTYLDVVDNGSGIPEGVRDQIFEPFFTTSHRGTGLGLYLTRELCEYNHARIQLMANSGGACFRLLFAGGT